MVDHLAETQEWVQRFVIGLNMCPFAKAPAQRDGIRYVLSRGVSPEERLAEILHECALLVEPDGPETTLFVLTDTLASFEAYMDFFSLAEALVDTSEYADALQLVSFHPEYCFDGVEASDPANATNRSPYPTVHLLKRADVAAAIASHPDIAQIPAQNVAKLRGQHTD